MPFAQRVLLPLLLLPLLLASVARGDSKRARGKHAFDRAWLRPYLTTGVAGRARDALLAGQPERAAKLLRRHLRRKRASRDQARYLLAHALLESKQYAEAASLFDALLKSYSLLEDYHRFYGARCRYKLKQFTRAASLAAAVDAGSPLRRDAELLRADALRAQGKYAEVVKIWRRYLESHSRGRQAGQAHYRIAQALEQLAAGARGDERQRLLAEALEHYKQVTIKHPLWRRAARAEQRLQQLARQVKGGAEKARLSDWQRFEQARAYYRKMRHEKAEPAFAALLAQKKPLSQKLRCRATYYLAKTVFRKRERARAAPLFARAAKLCREAGEKDLAVKSLYNGAKGLMRAHKYDEAIAQFGQVEREFAGHSYADDARLWAAEAAEAKGDAKQAAKLLDSLPKRYPDGDMRREALWRLARAAIIKRDHDEALRQLDRILDGMGRARYYYAHGQALYWKARILDMRKQPGKAQEFYQRCIRDYPLSYYALVSFNRLRERHPRLYRKLYGELIAPAGRKAGSWRFEPRELFGRPGFLRGVELARLGFGAAAAAELAAVGLGVRRGVDLDDLWLTAVLFDRAGLWNRSHQVPRSLDHRYRKSYPLAQEFRRWRIAYPRAYRPIVQAAARGADIPPELIWAVMREESGFSPTIESWANAVGLMQLLVRTAKRAGSQHRLEVTRRRLHDPAVNIKLGATYLGFLSKSFGGVPALAIAGYNAGEGSVLRWLRQRGNIPLDEFVDRIPYDQTRRYTKRVLSSLFAYSVLDRRGQRRIPRLKQRLPRPRRVTLGAKKRKSTKRKARRRKKK